MIVLFQPDFRRGNPYQELLARELSALGVSVRYGSRTTLLPFVREVLRRPRFDVLHLHWTSPFLVRRSLVKSLAMGTKTLAELLLLKSQGIRIVWTVHNLAEHERRHPRLERLFNRGVARLADAIIAHCENAREAVIKFLDLPPGVRAKFRIVPHGNYISSYPNRVARAEAREDLGLPATGAVFVCLGAVREYKGIPDLIRAFSKVADSQARLVIAGREGSQALKDEITELANADRRVRLYWGFVSDDRVQVFINASDAVVLPYSDVLTSGSAVLAMSFGRAVIAPRLGCLPETLGEACAVTLYNPHDGHALVEALQRTSTSDLDRLGEECFRQATRFEWSNVAEKTARIYAEVES